MTHSENRNLRRVVLAESNKQLSNLYYFLPNKQIKS